ncbi:hypothetical protein [Mycobacterium tuberculosis]|nr:hypothetical protein [Mycobacterium tuberculosis]
MTVSVAGSHGHLELNVFKPVIIYKAGVRLWQDRLRALGARAG